MNIEARKIEFIKEFLKLQSEDTIAKLEKILLKNKEEINPISVQELKDRINKSIEDSKNGRLTKGEDLLTEIEKWD